MPYVEIVIVLVAEVKIVKCVSYKEVVSDLYSLNNSDLLQAQLEHQLTHPFQISC